jgi:ParB family chromosome partitioning protein
MSNFENVIDTMLSQENQVKQIPLEMLQAYSNHKFKLYDGERLEDMVQSIKEHGVLTPIIVRPVDGGNYEILAGHNRVNASKIAER